MPVVGILSQDLSVVSENTLKPIGAAEMELLRYLYPQLAYYRGTNGTRYEITLPAG